MRIAYLTCVYPPYPGGIGVAAAGMAQEMTKRGHTVKVFAPIQQPMIHNSCFMIHRLRPWSHFGNAAFMPQLLWRLRSFDIIHLLYPFYGVAELLPLLRRITRAKIIVHHMMDAMAGGTLGAFFRWHSRHLMPRIFRAADVVLVLSEDYARNSEVAKLGVKWEVVPHGVDTQLFKCRMQNAECRMPVMLFVGGLDRAHYFKGVPVLIKACRILKDRGVKFVCQIVGEGKMRAEYEKNVAQTFRSDIRAKALSYTRGGSASGAPEAEPLDIQFLGLVPHDQLPHYYQRAAVCVVPSTEPIECFSIVAAEAQACGVSVVVTDFPGVRVTIEDRVTGFVIPPANVQALAERIQWILEHPQEAQAMGQAGRKRVAQMYSWKVVGDRLEGLYKELF